MSYNSSNRAWLRQGTHATEVGMRTEAGLTHPGGRAGHTTNRPQYRRRRESASQAESGSPKQKLCPHFLDFLKRVLQRNPN